MDFELTTVGVPTAGPVRALVADLKVYDAVTGLPANLMQDGEQVTTITTDATGRATFQAQDVLVARVEALGWSMLVESNQQKIAKGTFAGDLDAATDAAIDRAATAGKLITEAGANILYATPEYVDDVRGMVGVDSADYLTPGASTSQHAALTAALAAAGSAATFGAGTLILRPGEYLIDSMVTVPGEVREIRGLPGTVLHTTGNTTILALTSGTTVEGVEFRGTNPVGGVATLSAQNAITAIGAGTARLTDINIRRCRFTGFQGYGIVARFVERFEFTSNTFTDTGMSAIGIICCTDGLIDRNIIRGTGQLPSYAVNSYGVSLSLLSGTIDPVNNYPPARIHVTNNVVTNQAWEAIDTHGGDDLAFNNNIIVGCELGIAVTQKEGLVDGGPAQVVVSGNVINAAGYPANRVRAGISVNGASATGSTKLTTVLVSNNLVKGHGVSKDHPAQASSRSGAITMTVVASATVSGNTIIDALGNGVSFRSCTGVTVAGNTFQTVWRETGDTNRTSTLVWLENVTTASVTGNTLSVVASSLPNRNESTVRTIAGSPQITEAGNSWGAVSVDVALNTGWTPSSGFPPRVTREGRKGYLFGGVTPTSATNASGTVIGSIPDGYGLRPAALSTRLAGDSATGKALVDINSAGNVVLRSTYNSTETLYFAAPYDL